jgi:hypothetical protein
VAYAIVYNEADMQKRKNNQKNEISILIKKSSNKKALSNFIIERVITWHTLQLLSVVFYVKHKNKQMLCVPSPDHDQ